jgi:hypothetical protein
MPNRAEHRAQWVKTVKRWKASGLTQAAFAEREGLAVAALRAWCARLGEAPRGRRALAASEGARFVEIREAPTTARGALELQIGGELCLRFSGDVSADFVGAVVAAVRGRLC